MTPQTISKKYWHPCPGCIGQGHILRGPSKKRRRRHTRQMKLFKEGILSRPPEELDSNMDICLVCKGSGLQRTSTQQKIQSSYPRLAIIGAGIGGVALAVACKHRGIPFDLYEKDTSFSSRSQGYGLTLQQASKAIAGLGIENLEQGIISTRHIVKTNKGTTIGEWGLRKWRGDTIPKNSKRKNIHIARQSLRQQLFAQLGSTANVHWNHKLVHISNKEGKYELLFTNDVETKKRDVPDLVVMADGIHSIGRKNLFQTESKPLKYLGCIVVLGICPLSLINTDQTHLLDSATVFQTVNGHERIYMMPYDTDNIMWQFSVPIPEKQAKDLHKKGPTEMKKEVMKRISQWHQPIPEIVFATDPSRITGYPVYDREAITMDDLSHLNNATIIGDAAHPMSPFKGQGANQAILDALSLARNISKYCSGNSTWKEQGLRKTVLGEFEQEMTKRTQKKVIDSAIATNNLHSQEVMQQLDGPRGKGAKKPASTQKEIK